VLDEDLDVWRVVFAVVIVVVVDPEVSQVGFAG
jgi:hypothetical protein